MGGTGAPLVLAVGDGSVAVGLAVGLDVGVPDGVSVGLGVGVLVGVAAGVLDVLVLGVLVLGAGDDGGAPRAGPTRLGPCTGWRLPVKSSTIASANTPATATAPPVAIPAANARRSRRS